VSIVDILSLALLGGIIALDSVSVGQTMISRPIIAGPLAGLLLGVPGSGLTVGMLLELLAMETMPFGAARYLEWSAAAVVATGIVSAAQPPTPALLLVTLVCAVAAAWLAGVSMIVLRKMNARLVSRSQADVDLGGAGALLRLQALGVLLDFVRGAIVCAVALIAAYPLATALAPLLDQSGLARAAIFVAIPAAVAAGACWSMFGAGSRRKFLMLGGMVVGLFMVFGQ
jgi:mannose/fructose/N-acetylgalactosamine-specific phosphotransferase system component IIC